MENCLNIPEAVLEAMLTIACEFLDRDEYREKIGGTNWKNPEQAEKAWSEVKFCFERVAANRHLARPKKAVEEIAPVLAANGLKLNGYRNPSIPILILSLCKILFFGGSEEFGFGGYSEPLSSSSSVIKYSKKSAYEGHVSI